MTQMIPTKCRLLLLLEDREVPHTPFPAIWARTSLMITPIPRRFGLVRHGLYFPRLKHAQPAWGLSRWGAGKLKAQGMAVSAR